MDLFYGKGGDPLRTKEIEKQFTVKLAFIDAGMVTSLSERDQTNFFKFVWHVVTRDAEACTRHIKALSIHELDQ
jgi:predicted unusual protein kinase regulating ubiquinone biosynthesis (AarF/ABC1/UbiB family)